MKKNLSSNTNITAGHYSTDVSRYVNTDGYSCKESGDADYPYVVTANVSPALYGKALTLDGEIGVTYYFDMTGVEDPEEYELIAFIGGTSVETVFAEPRTIDNVEYYRYTVYVSPTELDSSITAYLTYGTTTVTTPDYSVYTYCEKAIKNEDGTWNAEKPLCEALLNYGYYLETWLGETSTINILSLDETWTDPLSETWGVNLSDYNKTANGVTGKTLALDGTGIFIRLNIDNPTSYYVEGIDDVVYGEGYLEFKVPAKEMSEIFTICNSDGTTYTTYSIYSYIKNYVDSEDTNLANLCKAIYYYSEESIAYGTNWQ
ncbi:MAG: hypothetical protein LUF29_01185 [Oscillospiraceae bacterium]|nr:hypothetical protein [Oscillospiraceae bacterium]